jgi:hypothetical protein
LNLEAKLDDYWDEDIGIKMSWTIYFEEYILREIKQPLVLAFDEVHRVFEHPKVAEDFLPLIRACYEESKRLSPVAEITFNYCSIHRILCFSAIRTVSF